MKMPASMVPILVITVSRLPLEDECFLSVMMEIGRARLSRVYVSYSPRAMLYYLTSGEFNYYSANLMSCHIDLVF